MIRRIWGALILCVALAASGAEAASDKPKPSNSPEPKESKESKPEARKEEPVSNDPQVTTATYGDWTERCQRVNLPDGTRRVCEIVLTVTASGQNQPLAEVAIGRAKKSDTLRLTVLLPVNVGFPSTPKVLASGGEALELSWKQCVPAGCFADAAFNAEMAETWRAAKSAKVESRVANGSPLDFDISLRGLAPALDALNREP